MILLSALVSGIALGSLYGLLALGYHVTWAVSRTVNFALGSAMMLGAVLLFSLSVTAGWPLALAVPAALVLCALYGAVVEQVAIRPFRRRGSDAWLIATVAAGIVLDNAVLFLFGKEPRGLASVLVREPVTIGGAGVFPLQIAIPLVALALAAGLALFATRTRLGRATRAVVQNPRAAALMGIDTAAVVTASHAASAILAGVAGMLVAPLGTVHASMGFLFGIKAFAVAILGGIESAAGVLAAGVLFGIGEALVTTYLGSSYTYVLSFGLVILVLAWRPDGLFGRAAARKV